MVNNGKLCDGMRLRMDRIRKEQRILDATERGLCLVRIQRRLKTNYITHYRPMAIKLQQCLVGINKFIETLVCLETKFYFGVIFGSCEVVFPFSRVQFVILFHISYSQNAFDFYSCRGIIKYTYILCVYLFLLKYSFCALVFPQ